MMANKKIKGFKLPMTLIIKFSTLVYTIVSYFWSFPGTILVEIRILNLSFLSWYILLAIIVLKSIYCPVLIFGDWKSWKSLSS